MIKFLLNGIAATVSIVVYLAMLVCFALLGVFLAAGMIKLFEVLNVLPFIKNFWGL